MFSVLSQTAADIWRSNTSKMKGQLHRFTWLLLDQREHLYCIILHSRCKFFIHSLVVAPWKRQGVNSDLKEPGFVFSFVIICSVAALNLDVAE